MMGTLYEIFMQPKQIYDYLLIEILKRDINTRVK